MVEQSKETQDEGVEVDIDESSVVGEEMFKLVNTVRSRHNRVQRMQHPVHARLKQHIGAGEHRVLRGRPLVLPKSQLVKHLDDIREKAEMGLIQVQTLDGRVIPPETLSEDFSSEKALPAAAPPALPNKPLDSANRDKNFNVGENIPQMPGGIALGQVSTGEDNTTAGGIPGPLENEKKSADPAADDMDTEVEDPAADPSDPAGG